MTETESRDLSGHPLFIHRTRWHSIQHAARAEEPKSKEKGVRIASTEDDVSGASTLSTHTTDDFSSVSSMSTPSFGSRSSSVSSLSAPSFSYGYYTKRTSMSSSVTSATESITSMSCISDPSIYLSDD